VTEEVLAVSDAEMYSPRGIGLNTTACFVCNSAPLRYYQDDMAAFVAGREGGERVVAMFEAAGAHARLDFRESEPNWVQVKIGACPMHKPNLVLLGYMTATKGEITPKILAEVLPAKISDPQTKDVIMDLIDRLDQVTRQIPATLHYDGGPVYGIELVQANLRHLIGKRV
jgi:hypothetical protein